MHFLLTHTTRHTTTKSSLATRLPEDVPRWRCLYAEIVNSRVESRTIDLDKALKRAVSMLIGRLRAYGLRWKVWAQASRYRSQRNKIGKKHRNKKLLFQTEDGDYIIHDAILDMATYLRLM